MERLIDDREEERPDHDDREANYETNTVAANEASEEDCTNHRELLFLVAPFFAGARFATGRLVAGFDSDFFTSATSGKT